MKSFQEYLTESRNSYKYRIRVANCDMTSDIVDRIELGLKKFDLISMSKPKSQPPEDRSYEFPDVGICGVHDFKIETNYPTNDAGLRTAVSRAAGVPENHVTAYTEEAFIDQIEKVEQVKKEKSDKKQSILANDKLESQPRPRDSMEMLKDLETRKYEFAAKNTEKVKSTNEMPQGNVSPVGTNKNKLPPMGRGAKR
jgi:hypothetical protein